MPDVFAVPLRMMRNHCGESCVRGALLGSNFGDNIHVGIMFSIFIVPWPGWQWSLMAFNMDCQCSWSTTRNETKIWLIMELL